MPIPCKYVHTNIVARDWRRLAVFYQDVFGCTPKGTYSTALSADGGTLFITFNISRGTRAWDCCGLAVVHISELERAP